MLEVLNQTTCWQEVLERASRLRQDWPSLADDPEHWFHIGQAQFGLGRRDDAIDAGVTVCRLLLAPRSLQHHKSDLPLETVASQLVALLPLTTDDGHTSLRSLLLELAHQAPSHPLVRALAAATTRAHPGERVRIANDLLTAEALVAAMETMQPQLSPEALQANTLQLAGARLGQEAGKDLVAWYLQQQPNDTTALHHLARHQVALDLEDDARQSLAKAYGIDTRDMQIELLLADLLNDCGQPNEAARHLGFLLEGAVQAGWTPWCVEILHRLGQLAFQQQAWTAAETHLTRALSLQPQHPGVLYTLGCTRVALGQYEAARQHLEHAQALDPSFEAAREALQDLQTLTDGQS
jgi:tetratricopeptide (TPR) repeat protein